MLKKIAMFCILSIGFLSFSNNSFAQGEDVKDKVDALVKAVTNKVNESEIENTVLNLMNYDIFFIKVLHDNEGDFWKSLTPDERNEIKKKYNSKYVKDYFSIVIKCNPLSVTFNNEDKIREKITRYSGQYQCGTDKMSIDMLASDDKVISISLNGISFIQNEEKGFEEFWKLNSNEEKKKYLMGS